MMHILDGHLQIRCPRIPEAPTSRQNESAKSQKPNESAEKIGEIQKPNKLAEQIGEVGQIWPPILGAGGGGLVSVYLSYFGQDPTGSGAITCFQPLVLLGGPQHYILTI